MRSTLAIAFVALAIASAAEQRNACGGTRNVRNLGDNHAASHPCPTPLPPLQATTTTTTTPEPSRASTALEGVAGAQVDDGASVASLHLSDAELGVGRIPEIIPTTTPNPSVFTSINVTSSLNASQSKKGGREVMQSSSVTAMAEKTTAVVGAVVAVSACASIAGVGAGPMPLIFQLQLLSQSGKIGGGSGALATFSESFGWANAELPFNIVPYTPVGNEDTDRRFRRKKLRHPGLGKTHEQEDPNCQEETLGRELTEEEEAECLQCGVINGVTMLDKLVVVAGSLAIVFALRWLLQTIITKWLKRDPWDALRFPNWEGPLLLAHWFGSCEALIRTIGLPCPLWFTASAVVLFIGPICFMMVCVHYIHKHMKNGDIVFEEAEKAYFEAKRNRGEWVEESKPAKFWSFLLKDLHGKSWKFFVWLLLKKLLLAAAMALTIGASNSLVVLMLQLVDCMALIWSFPSGDNLNNAQESFSAVSNFLFVVETMICASLPSFGMQVPDFLGDSILLCMALAGTAAAAVTSLLAPVMAFVGKISNLLDKLWKHVAGFTGVVASGASGGVLGAATGAVFDSIVEIVEDGAAELMVGDGSDGVDGDDPQYDLDHTNRAEGQASEAIGGFTAVDVGVAAVAGGVACSKTSVSTSKFKAMETEQSSGTEHDFSSQQPIRGPIQPRSPVLENVGLHLFTDGGRDGGEEAMNLLRREAVQRLETVKSSSTPPPPSISVARALSLSPSIPLFRLRALSLPLVEGKGDRGSFSTRSAAAGSPIPYSSTLTKVGKSEDTFSTRQSPKHGKKFKTKLQKAQERMRKGRLDSKENIERKAEEEQRDLAASDDEVEDLILQKSLKAEAGLKTVARQSKRERKMTTSQPRDGKVPIRNTSGPQDEEDHERNAKKMDIVKKESFKSEEDNNNACNQESAQRESQEKKGTCARFQKHEEGKEEEEEEEQEEEEEEEEEEEDLLTASAVNEVDSEREEETADQEECSNPSCRVAFTSMPFQEDFQTGGRVKEEEQQEQEQEQEQEGAVNEEGSEHEECEGDKETEEEEELKGKVQAKGVLAVNEEGVLVQDTKLGKGKKSMTSTGKQLEIIVGCEHGCGFCGSKFEVDQHALTCSWATPPSSSAEEDDDDTASGRLTAANGNESPRPPATLEVEAQKSSYRSIPQRIHTDDGKPHVSGANGCGFPAT